jgi:outer membrane receptor protein involved in Fe transport
LRLIVICLNKNNHSVVLEQWILEMHSWFRIILIFALLGTEAAMAQNIKGDVVNSANEGLPGALIQLIETKETTFSDEKGSFTLEAQSKAGLTLRVSLVGYQTQEIKITTAPLKIVLSEEVKQLDETVVYGKTETAAAKEMSIKAEVLDMKQSYSLPVNISELMNRSSGIRIRQTGGLGSATDVSLNGLQEKSIRYFRDGIPMEYLGDGFSLSSLPVNMLERVEIYKGVLPVNLGSDALGGAVNLVSRKVTKDYADLSYEVGSFNTHRANLNTYFSKNTLFFGVDGFFNHSDNDYKAQVKVTDPEIRNQTDATVWLFHNAFTGYFGQAFVGLKDQTWADEIRIDLAGFKFNRQQQHPVLMTDPFGAILAKQSSVIPSLRYNKQFDKISINQFVAYNTLTINRVDTLRGSYDWYGVFSPYVLKLGESRQASLSDIKNRHLTSTTNLRYLINENNFSELNQVFTTVKRAENDPYGSKFRDSQEDVLSLPLQYQKSVSSVGWNSTFGSFENLLMFKYFSFTSKGVETYQAPDVLTTDVKTISGYTWCVANGIKYNIGGNSLFRLSGEYSNRLPDPTEIFGDTVWIVQNFEIKPERSLNLNLGYRTHIRSKYTFEANGFYCTTKEMILLVPIQEPYARCENQQNVKGYGIELDGNVSLLGGWSVSVNATYPNMRLLGIKEYQEEWKNGTRLRNTPYLFANFGLNYQSKPFFNEKVFVKAFAFYSYVHEYYLNTLFKSTEGKGLFAKVKVNSPFNVV